MRKTLLHTAASILLTGMLGGHITELFDHWDHTLQTGRDVDYTVVIIAATVGVVFAVAKKFVSACMRLLGSAKLLQMTTPTFPGFRARPELLDTGPPLLSILSLRI